MNYTKKIIILVLFLSMGLYAYAPQDLNSGNGFFSAWKTAQKDMENSKQITAPLDIWNSGFFSGFVDGTKSALSVMGVIEIPEGVTNGQIMRVVGKYLEDHPELLHLTPNKLTTQALIQAFPKK